MHAARTLAADLAGAIRSPKKEGGELSGATGGGGIGAVGIDRAVEAVPVPRKAAGDILNRGRHPKWKFRPQ